jgi:hypothetical protein
MTDGEAQAVITYLMAAYDRHLEETTIAVYKESIANLDAHVAMGAARAHVATQDRFPTVAQLLRTVALAEHSDDPTAEEAWATVSELAQLRGLKGPKNGDWGHPLVAAAVEAVGWDRICLTEREPDAPDWIRKDFIDRYRELATRQLSHDQARPLLDGARAGKTLTVGEALRRALPAPPKAGGK